MIQQFPTFGLAMLQKESHNHFKAAVTVDNVIFGFDGKALKVLLIYRGAEPYKDRWALPGDFVPLDENLNQSAIHVLRSLTGLDNIYMEQVHAFGDVNRHPFGRVFTIAYYALIKVEDYQVQASSWVEEAAWFPINEIPELPFDHMEILEFAKQQLRNKIRTQPIGFELLPKHFTLTQIQELYEAVLEREFDTRNFRKKLLSMNLISETGYRQTDVSHRPAMLYKYDTKRYNRFLERGFSFDI